MLFSLAYLVSPLDFSPDVIPIWGWVDDGVLAALLATGLTEIVLERRRNLKAQAESESEAIAAAAATPDASAET